MHRSFKPKEAGSTPVIPIYPRRLMEKPGGHGPSDARSNRAGDAVTVADMVMQRIVDPPYADSVYAPFRAPSVTSYFFISLHSKKRVIVFCLSCFRRRLPPLQAAR